MEKILAYTEARSPVDTVLKKSKAPYRLASDAEALAMELEAHPPDLVVADISMTEADSARFLADMQSAARDSCVLLVNGNAQGAVENILRRFTTAQGAGSIHKPQAPTVGELHDPHSGRLDAQRTADWLGVSLSRFSKFLGRSTQTVHKTPAAVGLQRALAPYSRVALALTTLFGGSEQGRIWLNAPNPELDSVPPMSLFERHKPQIVAQLLDDALAGQPG